MNDLDLLARARKDAKVYLCFTGVLTVIVVANGAYAWHSHVTRLQFTFNLFCAAVSFAIFLRPYARAVDTINRLTRQRS